MKRILSCLSLLALLGCSDSEGNDDGATRILMAATFSKTGVSAVHTWGDAFDLAAEDATSGLQKAGYPTGKILAFRTHVADTRNDVAITTERAIELVQVDGAKMVINGTSSDTVALGKLAYDDDPENDLSVPILCVACSSPALHEPTATSVDPAVEGAYHNEERWIFGLAMSSQPQSNVLWNILVDSTPDENVPGDLNGDGSVKISTIALDDAFGTGFQEAMAKVVETASPDAIYERAKHAKDADVDQYDWAAALDQMLDDQTDGVRDVVPDVLIEFTFPQFSLALVKAYTGAVPFLHTHSMRERTVIVSAQDSLNGQEGTSYLPSDGESGRMFDDRFREVLAVPRQSQWDSTVYDGAFLFALGTVLATQDLEDPASVSGAEIRDAMLTLNDPDGEPIRIGPDEFAKAVSILADGGRINYEGASGPCDFDAYGRAKNRIAHWRVDNGQAKNVAVYDCVTDSTCPRMP